MESAFTTESSRGVYQRVDDHLVGADPGQIKVFAAPIDQITHANVGLLNPEESVEIVAETAGPERAEQQVFLLALLTSALAEAALATAELLCWA